MRAGFLKLRTGACDFNCLPTHLVTSAVMTMLVLFFANVTIARADTISLSNGDWPPFFSPDLPNGGFASEIVREAFSRVGVNVNYQYLPWKRSFMMAKTGQVDGSVVWVETPERTPFFLFSDSVLDLRTSFFIRKSKTIDWNGKVESIASILIAGNDGYDYGPINDWADDKLIKYFAGNNLETNLKMLHHRRVDAIIIQDDVGLFLAKKMGFENDFKIHPHPVNIMPHRLMLSKKMPNAEQYIMRFNQGLAEIKADGTYDRLLQWDVETQ